MLPWFPWVVLEMPVPMPMPTTITPANTAIVATLN
jgi:hypothetical protein